MHRCDDVIERLSDFVEGDLSDEGTRALMRELECAPCAAFLQSLLATRNAISRIRCEDIPSGCHARLSQVVADAVHRESTAPKRLGRAPRPSGQGRPPRDA